jgi:hypothetical protein
MALFLTKILFYELGHLRNCNLKAEIRCTSYLC